MPALSDNELAQQYGFAMAVLNSDPELADLFHQAVSGTWTADRFQAALRATNWYQSHNEQWRNAAVLKSADPQTYNTNVGQTQVRIGMMASQMGASLDNLPAFAEQAYQLGWDDNQIRQSLVQYIRYTDGRLIGQAGQWEQEARKQAEDNGLSFADAWYHDKITGVSRGTWTIDDVKSTITQMAASAFPNLADKLRAGDTLASLAEPYRQRMADLLEVSPNTITLQDPAIKAALSARDDKGQLVSKSLWEFENDTRSDPRWLKTKNAQDQAMSVTRKVLGDMGLVS